MDQVCNISPQRHCKGQKRRLAVGWLGVNMVQYASVMGVVQGISSRFPYLNIPKPLLTERKLANAKGKGKDCMEKVGWKSRFLQLNVRTHCLKRFLQCPERLHRLCWTDDMRWYGSRTNLFFPTDCIILNTISFEGAQGWPKVPEISLTLRSDTHLHSGCQTILYYTASPRSFLLSGHIDPSRTRDKAIGTVSSRRPLKRSSRTLSKMLRTVCTYAGHDVRCLDAELFRFLLPPVLLFFSWSFMLPPHSFHSGVLSSCPEFFFDVDQ